LVLILLTGLPFAVGLVRNTLVAASVAPRIVAGDGRGPSASRGRVERTLGWLVIALVAVGLGIPLAAVLQPLTGTAASAVGLMLLLGGTGYGVVRSASAFGAEVTSSAQLVAQALVPAGRAADVSRARGAPTEQRVAGDALPGLDRVTRIRVGADAASRDKTLAELDLRARTGATVVAIRRGDAQEVLPSGSAKLQCDDVLGLIGSPEAVDRARELLVAPGETAADR
jgi:CPA2 family monovalent cation:H+ antiporter-2